VGAVKELPIDCNRSYPATSLTLLKVVFATHAQVGQGVHVAEPFMQERVRLGPVIIQVS